MEKVNIIVESEDPDRDRTVVVFVNGKEVFSTNYDAVGWSGMDAVENCAVAIANAIDD